MRSYLPDSPQASARVLALILIADGGVADAELRAALAHPAAARLGLEPTLIDEVLRALCEDLQQVSRRRWGRELEPALLDPLLDEVRDARLRGELLQIGYAVVQADGVLSEGEGRLLAHLGRRWRPEHWAIAA